MDFYDWLNEKYKEFADGKSRQEGSQSAFARALKLKTGTVTSWLRKESMPESAENIGALLNYFGDEAKKYLKFPAESIVYASAHLATSKNTEEFQEWIDLLNQLTPAEREELKRIGWLKLDMKKKK